MTTPFFNDKGEAVIGVHRFKNKYKYEGKGAVTEWNWNGWTVGIKLPLKNKKWAKGVGAAGFLHGFMLDVDFTDLQ